MPRNTIGPETDAALLRQAHADVAELGLKRSTFLVALRHDDLRNATQEKLDRNEQRIAAEVATRKFRLSGYSSDAAVQLGETEGKDAYVTIKRNRRVDAQRETLTLRHDRTARCAVDGSIRPLSRDAHLPAPAYVTRGPDAFSFAERDAMRADATAPAIVAQWAACAGQSATGSVERVNANCQDLLAMAHSATNREQATQIGALWRNGQLRNASTMHDDIVAALGQGMSRATRHKLRTAFIAAAQR